MDISVIIPVYNTEPYLSRCIESVLAQKEVSLEIILVDDGSSDNSPKICDKYAARYPYITAIHSTNSGPASAKNKGLEIAKGDYITLTDSDDRMLPGMLSVMLEAARRNTADIVCCNYQQVDESGRISHTSYTEKEYVLDRKEGLIHLLSKNKIYTQCWTKIYRRNLLKKNNIRNKEGLKTDEDFIFNIHAFVKSQCCVIIDKPLYEYTHRNDSLAHDYFRQHISQYIDNRILQIKTTDDIIKNEMPELQEWSTAHNITYLNELIGKVALFTEFRQDARIETSIEYIQSHIYVLKKHKELCGFSTIGVLLVKYLPICLYMKYRNYKARK